MRLSSPRIRPGILTADSAYSLSKLLGTDLRFVRTNNLTIEPAGSDGYTRLVLEDVIDAPGEYEIRATVDGKYSDSVTWTIGERYTETASEQWEINLDWQEAIVVKRVANM